MIEEILGAGSFLTSLVGDAIDSNNIKKQKQKQIEAYKRLLITEGTMNNRQDRAGDTVYTKTMGELNSGALAGRGSLNPETLRTIAYTKMAIARSEAENNQFMADDSYNRNINTQIAQIEATPTPEINPMDAILEGVGGYMSGKQLTMQENLASKEMDLYDKMIGNIGTKSSILDADVFNINHTSNINNIGQEILKKMRKKSFNVPSDYFGLPERG